MAFDHCSRRMTLPLVLVMIAGLQASPVRAQCSKTSRIDFGVTPDDFGSANACTKAALPITTEYVQTQSIVFGTAIDMADTPDVAIVDKAECDPSCRSSGIPEFTTDWWCQFKLGDDAGVPGAPAGVSAFSAELCLIDAPEGTVLMEAYDNDAALIDSATNTTTGGSETLTVTAPEGMLIAFVHVVSSDAAEAGGLSVDCLEYPDPIERDNEKFVKWSQPPHGSMEGFNVASGVDWQTLSQQASGDPGPGPNAVVADDFQSDGRAVTQVRWWGSYINPAFLPDLPAAAPAVQDPGPSWSDLQSVDPAQRSDFLADLSDTQDRQGDPRRTAQGPGGAMVFLDAVAFEDFVVAQGKLLKGIDDFEQPVSNIGAGQIAFLTDPLQGGVPNVDGNDLGFPGGLLNFNLAIQSNVTATIAPEPNPGAGLAALGQGFIDPNTPIPNSVKVGANSFANSVDVILGPDVSAVGFSVEEPLAVGAVDVTLFDQDNMQLGDPTVLEIPVDDKTFFGVYYAPGIGRINIGSSGSGAELLDEIQLWAETVEPACTLYDVRSTFQMDNQSSGKLPTGAEDFEEGNVPAEMSADLIDPLLPGVSNLDEDLGFPKGIVQENLSLQSNSGGQGAPMPSAGGGLRALGQGFVDPKLPAPNSIVAGTRFPDVPADSLDLIFSGGGYSSVGFDVIDPVADPMQSAHITVFGASNQILTMATVPGPLTEKAFFGVSCNFDIGRINIAGASADMANDGAEYVDNIELWEPMCPGEGDCYDVHATAGCDDGSCCETVCAADPSCCTGEWTQACVDLAFDLCGNDVDGWVLSFHTDAETGAPADLLGVYFCPASALTLQATGVFGLDEHEVFEYLASLEDCCLLDSFEDPRDLSMPAVDGAFNETEGSLYWLDVQAVVGQTYVDCVETPTSNRADEPFWGWHTSAVENLENSATGVVVLDKVGGRLYMDWLPVDGSAHMLKRVDQAFELLTPEEGKANPCPEDCAKPGDGAVSIVDLLELIAQWGTPGSCDTDKSGTVNITDLLAIIAAWGACG